MRLCESSKVYTTNGTMSTKVFRRLTIEAKKQNIQTIKQNSKYNKKI